MAKSVKPILVIVALVLALVGTAVLRKVLEPKEIVPWRGEYAAAKREAAEKNRPLLLYFAADWCPGCRQMKVTTWADEKVEAALREYVVVKIDVDREPGLAEQFGVNPLPALIVLSPAGELLGFRAGYQSPEEFLSWLSAGPWRAPSTAPVP
jgi:protein disulfide-isomerase